MERFLVGPFYVLLICGGAVGAFVLMGPTTWRQPSLRTSMLRWLIVIALCAGQIACWRAADGFAADIGGAGPRTEALQWLIGSIVALWLAHQLWC